MSKMVKLGVNIIDRLLRVLVKIRCQINQCRMCLHAKKSMKMINNACNKVNEKKDVVIVRTDAIGDFVIWLAAAQHLRQYFENRTVTLICRKLNEELAEKTLLFDEVIAIDNDIEEILNKICGLQAEVLVQPMYSRNLFSEQVVSAIQCENKIAIDGDTTNYSKKLKRYYDKQYTKIYRTPDSDLHELERNKIFVEKLTGFAIKLDMFDLKGVLAESPNILVKKYVVVNLGGSSSDKQWPVDKYVKCASYIKEQIQLPCVLIGNRSEQYLAEKFLEQYDYDNVINIVGKTSVTEMMSIISKAVLVMCNDTSAVHIATACRVPCVCVAPGTYYPRFVPYPRDIDDKSKKPVVITNKMDCFGCMNEFGPEPKVKCIWKRHNGQCYDCISSVTTESVLTELKSIIKDLNI